MNLREDFEQWLKALCPTLRIQYVASLDMYSNMFVNGAFYAFSKLKEKTPKPSLWTLRWPDVDTLNYPTTFPTLERAKDYVCACRLSKSIEIVPLYELKTDTPTEHKTTIEQQLAEACDRIHDMLKDDDGQAYKEAEKFLARIENTPPETGS